LLESLTEFSLSGADRERAVDLLKQHPDASNRALARMAGINDKTIAKLRRELGGTSPFPRPGCREAVRTLPHFGDGQTPGKVRKVVRKALCGLRSGSLATMRCGACAK